MVVFCGPACGNIDSSRYKAVVAYSRSSGGNLVISLLEIAAGLVVLPAVVVQQR